MEELKEAVELTDKQRMLCEEYLIDLDATKAAIRAGYDENSAASTACHAMEKPVGKQDLRKLMDERSRKLGITAEAVLQELAWIAFARPEDFDVVLSEEAEEQVIKKVSGPAS